MSTNTYKCYKGHIFDSDPTIWRSKCPECGVYGVLFAGQITEDFVDSFARIFNDEATSDVILVADGTSFFAHKVVLAARSVYFKNLLYGGLRESYQDRVELEDAPGEAFGILLKYLYTGKIELELENNATVLNLFFLTHRYQIEKLRKYLEEYFESIVRAENICSLLSLGTHYLLNQLVINCCIFVHKNIEVAFSSSDFGCLSKEAFNLLFAIRGIHSKLSENTLTKALTKWNQTHPNQVDALSNALTTTGFSVKVIDGEISILKKITPALELLAEANKLEVPNSSTQQPSNENLAEVLSELSLDHLADNNMNISNSMIHQQSDHTSPNESTENATDNATDAEMFECWFDNCIRNPFPSEQARNVHFHEHVEDYIEEKSDLLDCYYEESFYERSSDGYGRSNYTDYYYEVSSEEESEWYRDGDNYFMYPGKYDY
ncbi:BTB/POZ domain-containing protein [Ditylenchus destructor]|uniref:BTB/POZ domain-containing protein n=1 Tax=Ditylenchus destructor TaxID=166010 RepID=A0AAD4QXA1_9BILA|nr:BTB/POZ domain-containing protein [Ditylenchus destructor]